MIILKFIFSVFRFILNGGHHGKVKTTYSKALLRSLVFHAKKLIMTY